MAAVCFPHVGVFLPLRIAQWRIMPRMWGARKSARAVRGERALDLTSREDEAKEKHGVLDPMPELSITSPCVHYRVEPNTMDLASGRLLDVLPYFKQLFQSQRRYL
jgi:hypothetical protein